MNILDLVEDWAAKKGWWTFKQEGTYQGRPDGYLYLAKSAPHHDGSWRPFITLWADARWAMDGDYPDDDNQKLEPADPDFFLNLEYLVITKTK